MKTERKVNKDTQYILFADLKEYSANKDSLDSIGKMEDALYEIGEKYFDEAEGHCFKVIGDGLLATDFDARDLAGKALEIITLIQNKFADDDSFEKKPKIRVALHLAEEGEIRERHVSYSDTLTILKDIAGKEVINTARIEPIVMPNCVFCSATFAEYLGKPRHIQKESLGKHELGKSHDKFELELFVLAQKDDALDVEALKKHIEDKLSDDKREETYQNASALSQTYINHGTQITGDGNTIVSGNDNTVDSKNVLKDVKVGNVGGDFHVGDKNTTNTNIEKQYNQNAEKVYNIDKIDKADFS